MHKSLLLFFANLWLLFQLTICEEAALSSSSNESSFSTPLSKVYMPDESKMDDISDLPVTILMARAQMHIGTVLAIVFLGTHGQKINVFRVKT
jgi:hypothetical protein